MLLFHVVIRRLARHTKEHVIHVRKKPDTINCANICRAEGARDGYCLINKVCHCVNSRIPTY
ncbi:putative defensin, invertebrate/fungal, knottin, scorpion toxin-like superfamily [Helianthus annuus]|nr:putative defensin, invertebrate/fungal, knottin, scorpion toxin-like superfamily [Helianthus annuus]